MSLKFNLCLWVQTSGLNSCPDVLDSLPQRLHKVEFSILHWRAFNRREKRESLESTPKALQLCRILKLTHQTFIVLVIHIAPLAISSLCVLGKGLHIFAICLTFSLLFIRILEGGMIFFQMLESFAPEQQTSWAFELSLIQFSEQKLCRSKSMPRKLTIYVSSGTRSKLQNFVTQFFY